MAASLKSTVAQVGIARASRSQDLRLQSSMCHIRVSSSCIRRPLARGSHGLLAAGSSGPPMPTTFNEQSEDQQLTQPLPVSLAECLQQGGCAAIRPQGGRQGGVLCPKARGQPAEHSSSSCRARCGGGLWPGGGRKGRHLRPDTML